MTTTAIQATQQPGALALATGLSQEQVNILKRIICKDATDDELLLYVHRCKTVGFDPLGGQMHMVKRKDHKTGNSAVAFQTGIDGFRSIADSTGEYAGNDDPVFEEGSGKFPTKATVTVFRMIQGQRVPFTASARWDEFFPGDAMGFMWKKMPHVMLGKCAEAQALRKAFPKKLQGLYVTEELDQDRAGAPDVKPEATRRAADLNARFLPGPVGASVARPASAQPAGARAAAAVDTVSAQAGKMDDRPMEELRARVYAMMDAFAALGVSEETVLAKAGVASVGLLTHAHCDALRDFYDECADQDGAKQED